MSPMPHARVAALLCLSLTLAVPAAHAAWPHAPNANLPMVTLAGDQRIPLSVSDGAGGAIVVWHDYRAGNWDLYVQRVNAAGTVQWTANGVALCTVANDQISPRITSDGAGGAIVAWTDTRSGNADVYVQRVNTAGTPQWTANGVALCTATGDQGECLIVSDGAGGAIVAWSDLRGGPTADVYARRVNAAGTPQWAPNGVPLCTASSDQYVTGMVSDGAGGGIATWHDLRSGSNDIYAQRVNATGAPQWIVNGVGLCTAVNDQDTPAIAADGMGGAIIAWRDDRDGLATYDIYAQRVSAAGAPYWFANGVVLTGAPNQQYSPVIVSDGAAGAIVTWLDRRAGTNFDVYAQRVNEAGTTLWTADGVPVSVAAGDPYGLGIVSDGAAGAIVSWEDVRTGAYDIYAQRVNGAGAPQWTVNGVALCTAPGDQASTAIVSDGAAGAIVAWDDYRTGTQYDVYAQRIERFGHLGNPEAAIAGVSDVPIDQGGKVKLSWDASYLDTETSPDLYDYAIYRSVPPNIASARMARGTRAVSSPTEGWRSATPSLWMTQSDGTAYFWEHVATVQAVHYLSGYSYLAPTAGDSTGNGNPPTAFMVVARNQALTMYWLSAPDSGYSVDNLGPATPAPFTGTYSSGTSHLHWGANSEADLAGYCLYRGNSADFVPGPGNLVVAHDETNYDDPGPPGSYYKLSAVDVHGNESPFALLTPPGTTDVPGVLLPARLWLGPASPNPAPGGVARIAFALPRAAEVRLGIYDQQGRRLRTLASGWLPAGEQQARWDGRDEQGRPAPSAIYFYRLEAEGRRFTGRVLAIH